MNSVLLVVSSSPSESNGIRALKLANEFRLQGRGVAIYLLQNAVFSALANSEQEVKTLMETTINSGIICYCSEEDLTMRGFKKEDLLSEIRLSSYSELVDLMMEKYNKVIGIA